VARAVGVEPAALVRLHQVHGIAAVIGTRSAVSAGPASTALPDADIVIVGDEDVAGAIQVADCVPVLLADRGRGVVAAAHAGWRGLAANGPRAALDALARTFGTRPADVVAAFGPSIGACCYEVGPEVRERFAVSGYPERTIARWFLQRPVSIDGNPAMPRVAQAVLRPDRWFFDGWAAARDQLLDAGVGASQIFGAGLCTASHPDVFCSYRRDGSPSGRLAGAIRCGRRLRQAVTDTGPA
jgi:YfiH family protein